MLTTSRVFPINTGLIILLFCSTDVKQRRQLQARSDEEPSARQHCRKRLTQADDLEKCVRNNTSDKTSSFEQRCEGMTKIDRPEEDERRSRDEVTSSARRRDSGDIAGRSHSPPSSRIRGSSFACGCCFMVFSQFDDLATHSLLHTRNEKSYEFSDGDGADVMTNEHSENVATGKACEESLKPSDDVTRRVARSVGKKQPCSFETSDASERSCKSECRYSTNIVSQLAGTDLTEQAQEETGAPDGESMCTRNVCGGQPHVFESLRRNRKPRRSEGPNTGITANGHSGTDTTGRACTELELELEPLKDVTKLNRSVWQEQLEEMKDESPGKTSVESCELQERRESVPDGSGVVATDVRENKDSLAEQVAECVWHFIKEENTFFDGSFSDGKKPEADWKLQTEPVVELTRLDSIRLALLAEAATADG